MKIVADRGVPYLAGVLEPYADVVYMDGSDICAHDIADAHALIVRTRTRCDEALLDGSSVKIIATATIGFDHIDMEYCRRKGIRVATSAGCNARAVLQWIGAVLRYLSILRRIGSPKDCTLGVVGVGNVGSLAAYYADMWGFRVLCCDPVRQRAQTDSALYTPPGGFETLEALTRSCDVVTFHVPLTTQGEDATFHMACGEFFGKLKPGCVVINASRGEVMDTKALLDSNIDCVIDTWENEPDIETSLVERAMLATPHIAGYSAQGKANGTAMAVGALADFFGWSVRDWYPFDKVTPTAIRDISWEEMCRTMPQYFDIETLSRTLKNDTSAFEAMRNNYTYREDFF